ncbi:MAG: tRNA (adenosine(37)-N6)-threonylcarbamoyltransferase complex transferase subunit TsaD [Nitrospirae bacterium]|nr:tRNA (adenosine(37)-N6)-threonylcarbamoyltransferase complex transferase subunit TsaD [Nitrospirota bacterium]
MLTLGIETSCDETAAAILEDRRIRSSIIASQADLHGPFGGVVPELASRSHVEAVDTVVRSALEKADCSASDIDLVGVTAGPGLPGALIVGVAFARTLAWALDKPLLAVNHLEGHILAARIENEEIGFPYLALLVSGGHTELVNVRGVADYEVLGRTRDDAAGEAFDKVGTLLGLHYPAGREIEELARRGDPSRVKFPRPMARKEGMDFSFSGLKTAVAVELRRLSREELESQKPHLAAGFQEAAVDALSRKLELAVDHLHPKWVVVCGGVAANGRLREKVRYMLNAVPGVKVHFPAPALCTDNAAMIAYAAFERWRAGRRESGPSEPVPRWELGQAAA